MSTIWKLNLITALSVLGMTAASHAAETIDMAGTHGENLTAALPLLPSDHPLGTEATVKLVSLRRASGLHEPTLATFIVDYSPGGSAVLHRAPSSGYVLVYVLSGAIRAYAWEAGVGTYHAGETWAEPAFAHNIATTNASSAEPARALVILVTGNAGPSESRE